MKSAGENFLQIQVLRSFLNKKPSVMLAAYMKQKFQKFLTASFFLQAPLADRVGKTKLISIRAISVGLFLVFNFLSGCSPHMIEEPAVKVNEQLGPYQSAGLNRSDLTNPEVLSAMAKVPRHKFVPEEYSSEAYADEALPIGSGQTISQPYIVALMTQEAQIKPEMKVLEIGTGSGYQAAVLSQLGARVFSVEIVPELSKRAEKTLKELGFKRIHLRVGDGWQGWAEAGPFDAILVTAASPSIPKQLLEQLAPGGRMILPIEEKDRSGETLMLIQRDGDDLITRDLGPVRFVPLTGEARKKKVEKTDVMKELGAPEKSKKK